MKIYRLYLLVLFLFASSKAFAQTKPATAASKPAGTVQSKPSFTSASDSLKFAINDFKSSMNNLFGGRKDTIALIISNVDYDDANLEGLKENLKKLKTAKLLGMQYKASVAKIELSFKGKSIDLWDQLPPESKKAFKIIEANDNSLMLENKALVKQ